MPHSYALTDKPAPSLSLLDANGETYTLEPDKVGKPVVIFFYPKSGTCRQFIATPKSSNRSYTKRTLCAVNPTGTYGCTKEACEFRDALVGETFRPINDMGCMLNTFHLPREGIFQDDTGTGGWYQLGPG